MNAISLFIFTSQWCKGAHVSRFNGQNDPSDKTISLVQFAHCKMFFIESPLLQRTYCCLKFQSGVSCIFPWMLQPTKGLFPFPHIILRGKSAGPFYIYLITFGTQWCSSGRQRKACVIPVHPSSPFLSYLNPLIFP